jgi:hypothetical protein
MMVLFACSSSGGTATGEDLTADRAADFDTISDSQHLGDRQGPEEILANDVAPTDQTVHADLAQETHQEEVVPNRPVDYLIIHRDSLAEVARAWSDFRQSTGHHVAVASIDEWSNQIPGTVSDDHVRGWIRDWVEEHFDLRDPNRPFFLLIIGDVEEDDSYVEGLIPGDYWSGHWQECYSDNHLADLDGDHVPDLAIGRIPARTVAQGLSVLERVVRHETQYTTGPWNRRFNMYAGDPDFGPEIDGLIETLGRSVIERVPYEWEVKFAYDVKSSTYYYTPFGDMILDMLTAGSALTVYVGHGGGELDVESLAAVQCKNRTPLMAFFACVTGDYFSSSRDCEAETVMKNQSGPTAILVSTATTHPYANHVLAAELQQVLFHERPETYGEAIMRAKWLTRYRQDEERETWRALAASFEDEGVLDGVLLDQIYVYNLLGDPAIRLRMPPRTVTVQGQDVVRGTDLAVSGHVDGWQQGTVRVALVCEHGRILGPMQTLPAQGTASYVQTVQSNWNNAMDHEVVVGTWPVTNGQFSGLLTVPASTPVGTYHVVAHANDGTTDQVGTKSIRVLNPPQ